MIKKHRNKINQVTRYLEESLDYIKESRNYIYLIIALFFISTALGFFYSDSLSFLNEYIKEILEKAEDLKGLDLIVFILLNNVQSSLTGLVLGIFFGIFSVLHALLNGVILGFVFSKVYAISGFSDFWRILPHGIFELPAIFISLGLGLKLGLFVFSKQMKKELKRRFYNSMKVFALVVVPLLIVAAIIEGLFITLVR